MTSDTNENENSDIMFALSKLAIQERDRLNQIGLAAESLNTNIKTFREKFQSLETEREVELYTTYLEMIVSFNDFISQQSKQSKQTVKCLSALDVAASTLVLKGMLTEIANAKLLKLTKTPATQAKKQPNPKA